MFDLTIRNGRVSTSVETFYADIGVKDGKIAAIAAALPRGTQDIDAQGQWVLPGGVDSHCHVEQLSGMGVMTADDFYSASVSAAFGGTTTIIPFAAQHRGQSLLEVVDDYYQRAASKSVIDFGFHVILTNPDEATLGAHLREVIARGITSFKVFMTYEAMKLTDYQILDVLYVAQQNNALIMLHAENNDIINWLAHRLIDNGHVAPRFHAVAHDPIAETEATHRALMLASVLNVPVLIVHVSGAQTVDLLRNARLKGIAVYAESCPQYLFLTGDDIDIEGVEGAKYCCSPPPRDIASQEAIWQGLLDDTLSIYSSDHAPYRFDQTGKLPYGEKTTFKQMANGVPGIELRLPLLFSEGVLKGRMSIERFIQLSSTNPAKMYGLYPQKGDLVVGADADIVVWNPHRKTTITHAQLHDQAGYTPYEGKEIIGWPEVVISRGRLVVDAGSLHVGRGSGCFIKRATPDLRDMTLAADSPRTRLIKKLV
ncbi:dihydropyrimidinase [Pseudomonas sp. NBRC 111131]|uniref:dihydropyrimidinase n=1 Tax=Pseudomonas sp. NBRC 111131 TaxID=1661046 RepID=UPI0006D3D367|nr:dihydropyrimidinase [Pseudomonas sp. NBRC 111131]